MGLCLKSQWTAIFFLGQGAPYPRSGSKGFLYCFLSLSVFFRLSLSLSGRSLAWGAGQEARRVAGHHQDSHCKQRNCRGNFTFCLFVCLLSGECWDLQVKCIRDIKRWSYENFRSERVVRVKILLCSQISTSIHFHCDTNVNQFHILSSWWWWHQRIWRPMPSISRWQIMCAECQGGPTTTTMPM